MHSKGTEASKIFKIKVKLLPWPSQANNPPGTSTQQIVRCVCWRACLAISAILVITNAGLSCQSHRGCISTLRGKFLFFSKTNFYPLKITMWRFTFFQSGCRHSGFPQSIMFPLIGWSLGHFWATLGNFSFYQPKNSEKVIFSFSPQSKFISSTHFLVPWLK